MPNPAEPALALCSVVSEQSGEDPAGSAWAIDRYFLVEVPLPWPYNMLESRHMPPGVRELIQRLYEEGIYWGWIGIAPDPEDTVSGMTGVVDLRLPDAPFRAYTRTEYLFPNARAGELAEIMVRTPDDPALLPFRQATDPALRDLLVCTHGTVDVCCATFGYPIYKLLRHMASSADHPLRVWRCTHFGGHRFAATLLDLPEGRYWGRLQARDLAHLVRRDVPAAQLRGSYRGWSALPHPSQQLAEAALLAHAGWAWTGHAVAPLGESPHMLQPVGAHTVAFAVTNPTTGQPGRVEVRLTPAGTIRTLPESRTDAYVEAPQYDAEIVAIEPPDLLTADPAVSSPVIRRAP